MIVADDPMELDGEALSVRVYDSSDVIHYEQCGASGEFAGDGSWDRNDPYSRRRRWQSDRVQVRAGRPLFQSADLHRPNSTAGGLGLAPSAVGN